MPNSVHRLNPMVNTDIDGHVFVYLEYDKPRARHDILYYTTLISYDI